MKCKAKHIDLISYLDNELLGEKKSQLEKHLEECADCRGFLAFLKDEMKVIENEKNQELNPFYFTRLSAKIEQPIGFTPERSWIRLAQPAFFTLVLFLGIYGGIRVGSIVNTDRFAQPDSASIQLLNDFDSEPIESFLLSEL